MERQPFQSSYDRQIAALEKRLSRALDYAFNISTPGWIEERVKDHPLRGWQKLSLAELSDEQYFTRLANTIIPLQTTLVGKTLPDIEERLKRLQEREAARIQGVRDQFDLNPLYPPLWDYSGISSSQQMADFFERTTENSARLIKTFLKSREATGILNAIVRLSGTKDLESNRFGKALTGALFEGIAYSHAASTNRGGDYTVLSPEETALLYKNLHPQRAYFPAEEFGLNMVVRNISMPDGLIIGNTEENLKIVLIVEYKNIGTSGRHKADQEEARNRADAQRKYYTPQQLKANLRLTNHQPLSPEDLGRLIHAIRPELPDKPVTVSPDLKPVYIVPINSNIQSIRNSMLERVPISTSAIHALAETLKEVSMLQNTS